MIVNVVSTAGFSGTAPGLAAYVGSKHAVRGMTKQMALELAPRGIRVLGVAPTFVPTEGNMAAAAAALAAMGDAARRVEHAERDVQSLIGRVGTPDDIARIVLFCRQRPGHDHDRQHAARGRGGNHLTDRDHPERPTVRPKVEACRPAQA